MHTNHSKFETRNSGLEELLQGEIISNSVIDFIFSSLEKGLLDRSETILNFMDVTFISVYFLERLEQFIERAKDLTVQVRLINLKPSIYKVFQVAKSKDILAVVI